MRVRSTWQKNNDSETPRQAATSRKADIYTMNQEHEQPSPVDYESGNPDTWAETPVPADKASVNGEYDGDHVKRNEIGLGEFRDDTWKHKDSDQWNGKGKYDNAKVAAERKALACERLARATLRTADESLIEGAAADLMALPDKSLVAMLKRLDAISPSALPEQARFKRALACTKLAARMLGASATAETVEKLGSVMMTVDDPTLKAIIRTVASARVAQQQDEQGQGQDQGGQDQGGQDQGEGVKTSQEQVSQDPPMDPPQDAEQQEQVSQDDQQAHGLSPDEMAMLDSMLQSEQDACAPVPSAPTIPAINAPAISDAPAPADDLSALFAGTPAAPAMPAMASGISFDDDETDESAAHQAADLDNLFADDPEVQAQRQIQAANQEARTRESGFSGRVASTKTAGAKKLGAIQKAPATAVDQVLERLWERP